MKRFLRALADAMQYGRQHESYKLEGLGAVLLDCCCGTTHFNVRVTKKLKTAV
jgi:ubiquinone/menaquinone biosynthesis C-methylase UbiE